VSNSFETIIVDIVLPFAYITLNRPDARNAMNAQMIQDLLVAFEGLHDNREVRAIVLDAAGTNFCVGGDIQEMVAISQQPDEANIAYASRVDALLRAINHAPQAVIAQVQGAAMGGGLGLVCVSDIAIASTDAIFGLPEVRLGIAPAMIAPFVIQRLGMTRTRELMLTGRRFNAEQAKEYGLVHEVCAVDELDSRVNAILDDLRQCSPNAIAACKRLMFEVMDKDSSETLDYRARLLLDLRRSDDGQEGMRAFLEKRSPKWAG
jgi:enoyl-CoA hydratase/carnithine racemase